jgi:hypothetical protein
MEETNETNASEPAVGQEISNAPKAEEITEPSPKEVVSETKVVESHETDQQFRSGLGRRVSKIEDTINSFIQEMRTAQTPKQYSNETPEYIATEDDVVRVLQKYETRKTEAVRNYDEQYLNHLARLGSEEGLNDQEFMRLENLVKTTFNQLRYQDPTADAERNFLKAMRIIDKERLSRGAKHINLKGDTPIATGTSGEEMIGNATAPLKLDKYAQEFVNYHKIPEEKVRKWLEE